MVKFNFVAALAAGCFAPSAKAYPKDKEFEFRPPGSDGVRSPCPALNTLANHGYINRDGKDIEIKDLMQAGEDVFSLSTGFIKALVDGNIRTGMVFEGQQNSVGGALLFNASDIAISCKMDLGALFNHTIGADHDVSLFRLDENVEEDALFDQSRFSKFLQTLDLMPPKRPWSRLLTSKLKTSWMVVLPTHTSSRLPTTTSSTLLREKRLHSLFSRVPRQMQLRS